jgi:hypothetical protein
MKQALAAAALLLVSGQLLAEEAPLGRLFLTPEQRMALDNARRNKIRAEAVAAAAEKKPRLPPARNVLINGVVKRSDGETIVWVNGKPVDGETPDGMQFRAAPRSDGAVMVREPERGRAVEIKVGQQVDMLTGRIQEPFQRRAAPAPKPQTQPAAAGPNRHKPQSQDARAAEDSPSEPSTAPSDDKAQ